ncbi:MAG TPA: T9SS type A sorting domain-containing protein [Flavobacterium sp.]|nr:T9SS type A sorting domain-containing protein [Flavobacterium sp.]
MKQVYLSFSLLLCGTFMNVANAQCTAVQTFSEDFENFTTFPDNCWVSNQSDPNAVMLTQGANIGLQLYSGTAQGDIIIVSPEVSTIDGQHGLVFDIVSANNTSATTIEIGTMTDNTDFSTFSAVGSPFTPSVGTHTTGTVAVNPGHKYVAIKFIHGGGHGKVVVLDNVKWTTNLNTPKFDTNKVTVYPNPSTNIFYVDTEIEMKSIEVYNMSGQRVLTTDQKQINLENAANGVYIANVTATDGAQASYKIVKK